MNIQMTGAPALRLLGGLDYRYDAENNARRSFDRPVADPVYFVGVTTDD